MILSLAPMLLAAPYINLLPLFAIDVFHGDASTQGLIFTVGGVAAIIGALIAASFGNKLSSTKILIGTAAGYGLGVMLFGRSPVLIMALGATFFSTVCFTQYQAQNQTILQTISPAYIRGRVLGVYMLSNSLYPIGSLLAGAMAAWWGGPMAVTLMGASSLVIVLAIALFSRSLWRVDLTAEREKAEPTPSV
jgi:MFS family permease